MRAQRNTIHPLFCTHEMSFGSVKALRRDLHGACVTLSELRLVFSARWAAEALAGLPLPDTPLVVPNDTLFDDCPGEHPPFLLARSYFDCKEFDRAAHALRDCSSGPALFLKLYLRYVSIDKKHSEESDGFVSVTAGRAAFVEHSHGEDNPDRKTDTANGIAGRLGAIILEVEAHHANASASGAPPNPFLLYLVGLIYNKRKLHTLAQDYLLESVKHFPYNWGAWEELLASFATHDEAAVFLERVRNKFPLLASHVMFQFFELVLLQEFYQQQTVFAEKIKPLCELFPDFTFLKVQKFLVSYHGLDYYQAEALFDEILMKDPMRLDDLDTYSNMLYVMEKKSKLSFLAQYTSQIDKFRSETCCVIANYHSMKSEHDKAVMYYKRALMLNKNCLSAWTLMGHEFVELKNSHAAIESYRRAVDINAKDFRAWYGLGQAYEVLDMHLYALYYYQRATNLQPTDKRMWQATGNCYEKVDKLEEALLSFSKALAIESSNRLNEDGSEALSVEPHTCYKLAMILQKLGRTKETYKYMRICFDQEFEWGVTDETSKARLWLARHALENRQYEEAYELAKEFNFSNVHDVEEARSIAKDARNRMSK